jgi:hypothetical protein
MTYIGFNTQNFTKINDSVYIYKNFLSAEECEIVSQRLKTGTAEYVTQNGAKQIMFNSQFIKNKINELIEPGSYIKGITGYNTPIDVFWLPHTDLDKATEAIYSKQWGIVGYVNDFDGGELLFPYFGIVLKPKAGDLVIHRASNFHSVALTKSNERLTYTSEIVTVTPGQSAEDTKKAIDFLVN